MLGMGFDPDITNTARTHRASARPFNVHGS